MPKSPRSLAAFLLLATLVLTGQGCRSSTAELQASVPVTLKVWRVFDNASTMSKIMNDYRALHPNVSFDYRQLRYDEYKEELVRAFAEGTGPDIFSVHNAWMPEMKSLIAPLPKSLTIPYEEIKGAIKKEKVITLKTEPTITPGEVRRDFLDVVAQDVLGPYQANPKAVPEERVFGLPLSVDTLAMFYNRDLLNAAGIPEAPTTWKEFQATVEALTVLGPDDTVVQSGAALGTSQNVERAFDILSLLMMQNGTQMTDDRGRATFAAEDRATRTIPGADAVAFYTDFANPLKEVYTWNADQTSSFDSFVSGKTAIFFGYSYHLPLIKTRAARLNWAVAPVPQIADARQVNYANYWVETISKASEVQNWAWDFVEYATSAEHVTDYLEAAGKPTGRRALINTQISDEELGPFVGQLLTAKSWYRGRDIEATEKAFLDLIDASLRGAILEEEIARTQNIVNQTL